MIGKPVIGQELDDLLIEGKKADDQRKELEDELASIKPGECLLYETREGEEAVLSLGLSLSPVRDLLIFRRLEKVYVYREKKK